MNNLKNINPRTLIMTVNQCFYCDNKNDIRMVCVDRLFGVKACEEHYDHARSNINNYMKKNKMIYAHTIIENEQVKKFFDYFNGSMKVVRSSGIIDNGWKFMKKDTETIPLVKYVNDEWFIPVIKSENDGYDEICKYIKLNSLMNPDLDYCYDTNFVKMYRKIIEIFNNEVIMNENDYNIETEDFPDGPFFVKYNIGDRDVRVFQTVY
jgi:hypothetical protein